MDSGNSGSMQSSSGGDEEYDSRGDSLSAFLNTPGAALAALSHHHSRVPTTSLHHHHLSPASSSSSPLFDPLSVYFDGLARSPPALPSSTSPLRSLDMPWPRAIGAPDPPSCTDGFGLMASELPPSDATNTIIPTPMSDSRGLYSGGIGISPSPSSSLPTLQHPSSVPPPHNPGPAAAAAPPRTSKKRSRASRRASTTVLTTDTSNFRAMVQEFTGLPAPPFASSPFPRARFDLLHAAASSVMRSSTMSDASPHYFLRPFAQQLPVFSSGPFSLGGSSTSTASFAPAAITSTVGSTTNVTATPVNATTIAAIATTSTSTATAISKSNTTSVATASAAISTNTASTSSYQMPSDLGLETQHQSFPNMFSCPSVVPPFSGTKYSSANVSVHLGNKKAVPGARAASTLGAAMADYTIGGGVRHGHADAHLGSVQTPTEPAGMMPSRGGGTAGDDLLRWVEGPAGGNSERGDQGQFRPAGGGSSGSQRGSSCKLNYAGAASSDYHAEKGGESVASARGEGMVESWICSSD